MERTARVLSHLRPASTSSPASSPTAAGSPLKLLSDEQVAQFVRDGYLILHISEVPAEVHRRIYDHAFVNQGGSVFNKGQHSSLEEMGDRAQLSPEEREQYASDFFGGVVNSPTLLGAMSSLLGPDFCGFTRDMQGGGAGGSASLPNALVSSTGDNQHHKDGTSQPVREHRFRSVGYWYYPHAVSIEMGPTCVVNRSHLWGLDQSTFPHSEERLDRALVPPKPLEDWGDALMGWNGFALSMHSDSPIDPRTGRPASGEVAAAERDARVSAGIGMLGDPKAVREGEVKLTVPAGSIVVKHNDIFHRVARSGVDGISNEGVPWRPMFSGVFFRGSEPTAAACATSAPAIVLPEGGDEAETSVWGANLSWLTGGRTQLPPTSTAAVVAALRETLSASDSEVQRVGAATQLGAICRADGGDDIGNTAAAAALEALLHAITSEREATQRAAAYGCSVGGGVRLTLALCEVICTQLERDEAPMAPPAFSARSFGPTGLGTSPQYCFHVVTSACFALGESISHISDGVGSTVLDALEAVIRTARHGIKARLTALPELEVDAVESEKNNG